MNKSAGKPVCKARKPDGTICGAIPGPGFDKGYCGRHEVSHMVRGTVNPAVNFTPSPLNVKKKKYADWVQSNIDSSNENLAAAMLKFEDATGQDPIPRIERDLFELEMLLEEHDVEVPVAEILTCLVEPTKENFDSAGMANKHEAYQMLINSPGSSYEEGPLYPSPFDRVGTQLLFSLKTGVPTYSLSDSEISPSLIGKTVLEAGYVFNNERYNELFGTLDLADDVEGRIDDGTNVDLAQLESIVGVLWMEDQNLIENYSRREVISREETKRLLRVYKASSGTYMSDSVSLVEQVSISQGTEDDALRHINQGFMDTLRTGDERHTIDGLNNARNYHIEPELEQKIERLWLDTLHS